MTMSINPAFLQGALLKSSAKNSWGGTGNTAKLTEETTNAAMRDMMAQQAYGLHKKMNDAQIINMAEKLKIAQGYLGIDTAKVGLAGQELGIQQQNQSWREKNWRKTYDTEKSNLWKTAALGLGTGAWSAYEGNRRAEAIRADSALTRQSMADWSKYFANTEEEKKKKALSYNVDLYGGR